jgi:proteasome lid subunit RPN8/RPN11
MSMVRVSILDPSGSRKTTAEVPDNVSAERLTGALVPRMSLPVADESGRPINYRLAITRGGEQTQLPPEQTLADAQVQNDDVLRLYAEMQAGKDGQSGLAPIAGGEAGAVADPAPGVPLDLCEIKIHAADTVDKPVPGLPYAAPVEIIVDQAAWNQITRHAGEDLRHELGGLMVGEIYEHAGHRAVRVTAAVPARGAVNSMASIQFTSDAWTEMERLRRDHTAGEKLVGWYHTHPGFTAFFSATDTFMHESFFNQPWHVALVLDPVSGEHRFYRWEAGKVKASSEFLLQRSDWQGPPAPLHLVLGSSLRRAAAELEQTPESAGAVLAPELRRLAASLLPAAPRAGADLLPLLVACSELPADVTAAARQLLQRDPAASLPLALADCSSPSRNHNPSGALAIAFGWLAQLSSPHHVHAHCLEGPQPLCRTLALPMPAQDLACDERGNLLLLTRDAIQPLRLLQPPLPALHAGAGNGDALERLALAPVEIDWRSHAPAAKVGRIERGRRHLYLLTRGAIFVLGCADPRQPARFHVDSVQPAAACGWESFTKLTDWAVDSADNLFLLMRPSREIWRFDPLQESWQRFPAADLERPSHLAAGLTSLWVHDEGRQEIARFGIPDGHLLDRRPLGEGLRGRRIWALASDGYRRLYIATDDDVLCVG